MYFVAINKLLTIVFNSNENIFFSLYDLVKVENAM